jgi:hypothetical protein
MNINESIGLSYKNIFLCMVINNNFHKKNSIRFYLLVIFKIGEDMFAIL